MTARESAKQALELICNNCDPKADCGLCRLKQFDMTLELIAKGMRAEQAFKLSEDAARQCLKKRQDRYDAEYSLEV